MEFAVQQWRAGEARLARVAAGDLAAVERAVERIGEELRRRLGGAFTTAELADEWHRGTDWAVDLAMAVAPRTPAAWDPTVADAAFHRFGQGAMDYAGGRTAG